MKLVNDIMGRIDALSVRERAAIFIAVLAVIFFVWDSYLMTSLNSREKTFRTRLQQKQAEQAALNTELQALISASQNDPNAANREKLATLKGQLEKVRTEVTESTRHLISPKRMAAVLESVLARTQGLELVEVKGVGASPLFAREDQKEPGKDKPRTSAVTDKPGEEEGVSNAYKHGLKVVFNGSYMATLEYVKKLEELDSVFIWDNLQLKVSDYPDAETSITVFTLSLDRNWIGA